MKRIHTSVLIALALALSMSVVFPTRAEAISKRVKHAFDVAAVEVGADYFVDSRLMRNHARAETKQRTHTNFEPKEG